MDVTENSKNSKYLKKWNFDEIENWSKLRKQWNWNSTKLNVRQNWKSFLIFDFVQFKNYSNFQFLRIFSFIQFSILSNIQFCRIFNFVWFSILRILNFVHFAILSNFHFCSTIFDRFLIFNIFFSGSSLWSILSTMQYFRSRLLFKAYLVDQYGFLCLTLEVQ